MSVGSLTNRQCVVLAMMFQFDRAMFMSGRRYFSWVEYEDIGVVMWVFQCPQLYLKARGLIKIAPSNLPGNWYLLSDAAEALCEKWKRTGRLSRILASAGVKATPSVIATQEEP